MGIHCIDVVLTNCCDKSKAQIANVIEVGEREARGALSVLAQLLINGRYVLLVLFPAW